MRLTTGCDRWLPPQGSASATWCWYRFRSRISRAPRSARPSSSQATPLGFGEAMVGDWQGAGLVKESVLKPVFTTIEQGLVIRVMGHLSAADIKTMREVVSDVIG